MGYANAQIAQPYGIEFELTENMVATAYAVAESATEPAVGDPLTAEVTTANNDSFTFKFKGVNARCDLFQDTTMIAKGVNMCSFKDITLSGSEMSTELDYDFITGETGNAASSTWKFDCVVTDLLSTSYEAMYGCDSGLRSLMGVSQKSPYWYMLSSSLDMSDDLAQAMIGLQILLDGTSAVVPHLVENGQCFVFGSSLISSVMNNFWTWSNASYDLSTFKYLMAASTLVTGGLQVFEKGVNCVGQVSKSE